jgi:hypothetical protein
MNVEIFPARDLGLQHLLENGLAVIRDEPALSSRREEVLATLLEVISEADKGGVAVTTQNLLSSMSGGPALERFSTFFRYLKDSFGDDVPERLSEAATVLSALKEQRPHDDESTSRTIRLIETLLNGVRRDRALRPLLPPLDLNPI